MKKVKIAVWLDENCNPEQGGGFSYYDKLVQAIDNYQFDSSIELCFVTAGIVSAGYFQKQITRLTYAPQKLPIPFSTRIKMIFPFIGKLIKQENRRREVEWHKQEKHDTYLKILLEAGIQIIYYPCCWGYPTFNFPFISTNWDIGHCSTFPFPELISNGSFEYRNYIYTQAFPKALMIFCESEAGKAELLKFTNIDEKKIKIVPLFAGNCVNMQNETITEEAFLSENKLEKYKFFFYPAQFWAHKNHSGLLQAFSKFSSKYPDYKLVFTGSDKGNLEYIFALTAELKLESSVLFLGFLPTAQVNILYGNATSLIMATYLGPTNMPLIEAMELGCPVVCSDLEGHREILGDSALYFNPADKNELSNAMVEMVGNRDFYKKAIEKQNRISIFKIDNSLNKINEYFKEIAIIRSCYY